MSLPIVKQTKTFDYTHKIGRPTKHNEYALGQLE